MIELSKNVQLLHLRQRKTLLYKEVKTQGRCSNHWFHMRPKIVNKVTLMTVKQQRRSNQQTKGEEQKTNGRLKVFLSWMTVRLLLHLNTRYETYYKVSLW